MIRVRPVLPPLKDVCKRAHIELNRNPTITAYVMAEDGVAVPYDPARIMPAWRLQKMLESMQQKLFDLGVAFEDLGKQASAMAPKFETFSKAVRENMSPWQRFRLWLG